MAAVGWSGLVPNGRKAGRSNWPSNKAADHAAD